MDIRDFNPGPNFNPGITGLKNSNPGIPGLIPGLKNALILSRKVEKSAKNCKNVLTYEYENFRFKFI